MSNKSNKLKSFCDDEVFNEYHTRSYKKRLIRNNSDNDLLNYFSNNNDDDCFDDDELAGGVVYSDVDDALADAYSSLDEDDVPTVVSFSRSLSDTAEEIAHRAVEIKRRAGVRARRIKHRARFIAQRAGVKAEEFAQRAGEKAEELAVKAGEKAEELKNRAGAKAEELAQAADDFAQRAEELAQLVLEAGWTAVNHHSLPWWMRDNDYLKSGHRPHLPSFRVCFQSIFRIHTETGNIWTHLLGFLAFLGITVHFLSRPAVEIQTQV